MKSTIILAAILLAACGSNTTTDVENMQLNGKVKSVRTTTYDAVEKFGSIVKGDRYWSEECIEFDQQGREVERVRHFNIGDEKTTHRINFLYDNNGDLSEVNSYENDTLEYRVVHTDNETLIYDSDGNLDSRHPLHEPDPSKDIDTVKNYKDGVLSRVDIYKFKDELCIEYASYDADGALESKYLNKYNSQNQRIEIILVEGDRADTARLEYDKKGLLLACENIDPSDIKYTNPQIQYARGDKYTLKYDEFDKHDNWTKQIEYKQYSYEKSPNARYVIERRISYY